MQMDIPVDLIVQTVLTGAVGWAVKNVLDQMKKDREETLEWRENMDEKVDNVQNATQATMRTTILHYCEKYLSRGWITSEELSSLTDMYQKYTKLNSDNGFITGYMTRVSQLKVKEI